MTGTLPAITDVIAKALQPGPANGPVALRAALETEDSPFDALRGANGTGVIGSAIDQDFGFLRLLRTRPDADEAIERWVGLIRWLLTAAKGWKLSEDRRMNELAAILLTSRRCGGEAELWQLLPEAAAPAAEFLSALAVFVAKRHFVYDVQGTPSPPIWENEFIEAFQRADTAEDWPKVAAMWPQFDHVVRPDILSMEMVRCLARYGFDELVRATDALQQCPPVMEIAGTLSAGQRLRLAIASSSERVRFCCAFVTVARSAGAVALSPDEDVALSQLLIKVATSAEEWRKWMKAFNTYPLRHPHLHRPLGHALAQISHDAAKVYLNSIELHPIPVTNTDESRALISVCLRAFSQQASPEHRQAVWTHAYRLWCDWRFGASTADTHLFDINRSSLDFAVTSYACECMSATERETALAELQKQFPEIELAWHTTESNCITAWNRLLSLFQPYAHACSIAETGADALLDTVIYYPFDLTKSLYHRIMFRVPAHPIRSMSD